MVKSSVSNWIMYDFSQLNVATHALSRLTPPLSAIISCVSLPLFLCF